MYGMDPMKLLDQGREDRLVNLALLHKAIEVESHRKYEEYKVLAQLTSIELSKILVKLF